MKIQRVAQAGERSALAKSTDMRTTIYATIYADNYMHKWTQAPLQHRAFSIGKNVSTFITMSFDLDKRTAELVGIDVLTISRKEADRGGEREGKKESRSTSGSKPSPIW